MPLKNDADRVREVFLNMKRRVIMSLKSDVDRVREAFLNIRERPKKAQRNQVIQQYVKLLEQSKAQQCSLCGEYPMISKHYKENLYRVSHYCKASGSMNYVGTWLEHVEDAGHEWNYEHAVSY